MMSKHVTDESPTGEGVPSHADKAQERAIVRRRRQRRSFRLKFEETAEKEERGKEKVCIKLTQKPTMEDL